MARACSAFDKNGCRVEEGDGGRNSTNGPRRSSGGRAYYSGPGLARAYDRAEDRA